MGAASGWVSLSDANQLLTLQRDNAAKNHIDSTARAAANSQA